MTNYPQIIRRLTEEDWAITPAAYESLWAALEQHMRHKNSDFTADEMRISLAAKPPGANGVFKLGNGTAVMDIAGVIGKRLSMMESMCGGVSVDGIVQAAQTLAADPTVSNIVMNWHSPGGVVTGVPEAYQALSEIAQTPGKTLISYTETECCSAAAWLASAATSSYASATADTASIGVYNLSVDRSRQMANEGIQVEAVHAGRLKLMNAPFKAVTDEERALRQERVDNIHANFKVAVTAGRTVDPKALEGQTLTGAKSKAAGLIDGIYPSLAALLQAIG